ncbi:hypothetical protein KBY91_25765 [Streptomyces sp. RK23]|uniref:hypothetical protein n=1 Tax=unclassified Streptomyces TaxID=2593676 RepID=UPI001B382105|nr:MULTISPECIES: hypothetical protein [unclassified Streptomyces]MBQ0968168.1 hypothetical protein [Streptomyces sp. RK74B]MBQ1006815.1 hypothetical protein [Streptomyces sp. RK23]
MGTKTVDETGVKTDERKTDEATEAAASTEAAEATEAPEAAETAGTDTPDDTDTPEDGDVTGKTDGTDGTEAGPTGVGQGAGAVVSAGLGIVSLTGSWVGTVASARESLMGQLQTSSSSDVGTLIEKGYGNAWQATAMWGGIFALGALIVGVVVLARPAFGAPGRPQAPWIKSVAWAGVALGVIGLLLAVLKYTDVLLGLPATG